MFKLKRDTCITIIYKSILIALSVWFICLFCFCLFVFVCLFVCLFVCFCCCFNFFLLQTIPTNLVRFFFYLFWCICCKTLNTWLVLVSLNHPIRSLHIRFSVLIGFYRNIVTCLKFLWYPGRCLIHVLVFCFVVLLLFCVRIVNVISLRTWIHCVCRI